VHGASDGHGPAHPVAARFRLNRFATGHLLDEEGTGSQHNLHMNPARSPPRGYLGQDETRQLHAHDLPPSLRSPPPDRREFYYYGAEDYLNRPAPDAPPEAWDDYLHNRDNPAGVTRDLWYHDMGCSSSWLVVTRNTVTHEITGVVAVADRKGGAA
jgi:methylglutamate dehydrogenase subunit B